MTAQAQPKNDRDMMIPIGQAAYSAYCRILSFSGTPVQSWMELSDEYQTAWASAGAMAVQEFFKLTGERSV